MFYLEISLLNINLNNNNQKMKHSNKNISKMHVNQNRLINTLKLKNSTAYGILNDQKESWDHRFLLFAVVKVEIKSRVLKP